jgi:hypothetical protein
MRHVALIWISFDRIMSPILLYSHGEIRHCDPDSSAVDTSREEGVVSPVVSAGCRKGTGAAASAADARVGVQVGPYCAFADVSAAAPAIASADTARRSRFIYNSSFFALKCNAHRREAVLVITGI